MPRIREQTVYTIQELTGEARSRALQKLAEWNTSHDWWDYTVDDAKRMGAILGIQIDDVRFSGFSSQGDGASFVGSYRYANGSRKAIRREAPQDTELHRIADKLADIERRNFYRLTATVTERRGAHYAHEYTVDVETDDGRDDDTGDKGTLADTLRDFMRWVYKQLEQEYEYQTSEQACIESADANEYEFDESGCVV